MAYQGSVTTFLIMVGAVGALAAQTETLPSFEAVSVRPNLEVGQAGSISGPNTPQFRIANIPLRQIILYAYDLRDHQLIGGPEWTRSAKFDIAAIYPEGADSRAQHRQMLQRLLGERFRLNARRETRDDPIYRLVVARADGRLGPQLTSSDLDCERLFAEKRSQVGAGGKSPVTPNGTRYACAMMGQRNWISGSSQPLSRLALQLESRVGRPVVDATGLSGTFDLDVQWAPETALEQQGAGQPSRTDASDSGSIFTAIQEQLGLKLESVRGPVDVVVIESVERPVVD